MPFQPGVAANPGGRSRPGFTWQNFCDRTAILSEKYEADQILDLKNKIAAGKKVPLSSFDCLIISYLGGALAGDMKTGDRLLDRLWGKAVQRIGGEAPGEGIKINAAPSFALENADMETLRELAQAIRTARERVAEKKPAPLLAAPVDSSPETED